jgi:hypothetical protein
MKKSDVTKLLAVTWLICVCILHTSLSHAGTITDNFAGASINTGLWTPFNDFQQQRVFQQDGELRIQIDGASAGGSFGAGLQSKFNLKGDFVMTVDYRLITWPNANGVRLGFEGPGTSPDDTAGVMVKRRSPGIAEPTPGEQYSADFKDGNTRYGFIIPDTAMNGSLKLTRVGSVLTGYFADQPNVWQQIGSHNYSAPGLPEWAGITLWANSKTAEQLPDGSWFNKFAGQDVEIAFDNFQVTYDQIRYTSVPGPSLLLLLD